MAAIKAEYQDNTGNTDAFTIECPAAGGGMTHLVGALEDMQSQLNTKLTALLDAEKAAQSSASVSSTTVSSTPVSSEQACQRKRQKSD
ncbi:hypothetical protein GGH15_001245 [Coemansia sp. RSA 562]|nr:hypothetical protein GGH15_001245 [Coemansia sp. RSA 562]KAJ2275636.1 hypothetical protein J3F81_001731 [Coemansia sp. RSA 371]